MEISDLSTSAKPRPPIRLTVLRYALALGSVAVALLLSLLLQPLSPHTFVFPFLAAAMAAGWFCGKEPSMLAVLYSSLCVNYFFIPSVHSFSISREELPYFFGFALSATSAGWLGSWRREAPG